MFGKRKFDQQSEPKRVDSGATGFCRGIVITHPLLQSVGSNCCDDTSPAYKMLEALKVGKVLDHKLAK
jgi:hypothetical protein